MTTGRAVSPGVSAAAAGFAGSLGPAAAAAGAGAGSGAAGVSAGESAPRATGQRREAEGVDVTPEPRFFPKAGAFDKDTEVTLRCDASQATIHYTVDGSQPVAGSPVYQAPIMVKGTELTIKAYAGAAGKKDSAVVTGIFRIRETAQ